jgi:hypothetical protein
MSLNSTVTPTPAPSGSSITGILAPINSILYPITSTVGGLVQSFLGTVGLSSNTTLNSIVNLIFYSEPILMVIIAVGIILGIYLATSGRGGNSQPRPAYPPPYYPRPPPYGYGGYGYGGKRSKRKEKKK